MEALTRNKSIVLGIILVAIIGAVAIVTLPPATGTREETARELSEDLSETVGEEQVSTAPTSTQEAQGQEEEESYEVSGPAASQSAASSVLAILKDVGEPAYDRFGLIENDFLAIKQAGFDIIEGNFDICADDADVKFFLDSAERAGLIVILNAGAGEAEWGYSCDEDFTLDQKPVWQREGVGAWVQKWKNHPALYAWDTANEDGGTFPFGTGGVKPDPEWETKYSLSAEQLQEAYRDVKSFDLSHPVMIRMNGWYFYDYSENFFRPGNAFEKDVADIVMINAYSNVDEYFKDFVSTVLRRATRAIYAIDPHVKIIPALGVWEEPPMWVKPTVEHLVNDYAQALKAENLLGVAFFKYGAREGSDWFLPDTTRGAPEIWQKIRELIR